MKIKWFSQCSMFAILILSVIAVAQTNSVTTSKGKGQKAYTTPVSKEELSLTINTSSNHTFTLTVQNGAMGKIFLSQTKSYALVPIIKDLNKKTAEIIIFQVQEDKEGNESVQEVERIIANGSVPVSMRTEPGIGIKIVGIKSSSANSLESKSCSKANPQVAFVKAEDADCCVSACNATACGSPSASITCPNGFFVSCTDPPPNGGGGGPGQNQCRLVLPLSRHRDLTQLRPMVIPE